MKMRLIALLLGICILASCCIPAMANSSGAAEDISDDTNLVGIGFHDFDFLFDGDLLTSQTAFGDASFSLLNEEGIGYLYLIFDKAYPSYTIENVTTGKRVTVGGYGSLHDCIDLSQYFDELPIAVTLRFSDGKVALNELMVFSDGILPDDVQQWKPPAEGKADILLLCAHGDDEHLFYAGLLPLYAGEKNATVQVAYLTDHRNITSERAHEMLNGLWAVGCDTYPVFAKFPDFRIDDLQKTYDEYEQQDVTREDLMEFVVEQLRRFKPQVVVGHDIQGEYGHGMHMAYTDCLIQALDESNNEEIFPKLAQKYGVWDVPKVYLHLYEENPIVVDYDQPLSGFDGMTAFEISQQKGYPCHKSQQGTWFTDWLYGDDGEITAASQIRTYNPCQFGLYRSKVGADLKKNDFLENIITYAMQEQLEQIRLEQEKAEQERLEQEKLERERDELLRLEQERLEQQRLEQEEAAREQLRQEQLQQQQQQEEEADTKLNTIALFLAPLLLVGVVLIVVIILIYMRRRNDM